jgi:RimJ/RimL family protein N-acetyltransferase
MAHCASGIGEGIKASERSEVSGAGFTRLESERLILRRFTDSDLAPFLAYRTDPEVARYQAWESCTEREAIAMIEELKALQPGTPGEWFQFAIDLKEMGVLIGDCTLKVEQDGRQAEIGYTLSLSSIRARATPRRPSRASWITRSGIWGCTG